MQLIDTTGVSTLRNSSFCKGFHSTLSNEVLYFSSYHSYPWLVIFTSGAWKTFDVAWLMEQEEKDEEVPGGAEKAGKSNALR